MWVSASPGRDRRVEWLEVFAYLTFTGERAPTFAWKCQRRCSARILHDLARVDFSRCKSSSVKRGPARGMVGVWRQRLIFEYLTFTGERHLAYETKAEPCGRSLIAADPRIHPAEFTLSSQDWMSRGRQEQGGSGFKNEGQAALGPYCCHTT